jgi:hypothetical protein
MLKELKKYQPPHPQKSLLNPHCVPAALATCTTREASEKPPAGFAQDPSSSPDPPCCSAQDPPPLLLHLNAA